MNPLVLLVTRFTLPLTLIAFLALAFTVMSQAREVFRGYVFDSVANPVHAAWVLLALVFTAAVLARMAAFAWTRIRPDDPLSIRSVAMFALAPIILVGLGLVVAGLETRGTGLLARGSLAAILLGAILVGGPVWFVAGTAYGERFAREVQRRAQSRDATRLTTLVAAILTAKFLLLPLLPADTFIWGSRLIGTFPAVMLQAAILGYAVHRFRTRAWSETEVRTLWTVVLFGGLLVAVGGQRVGGDFSFGAALIGVAFALFAALERRRRQSSARMATTAMICIIAVVLALGDVRRGTAVRTLPLDAAMPPHVQAARNLPDLTEQFEAWLAARPDKEKFTRYPVFIVAAQGGGLFAAHYTAMMLASIQDTCPQFRDHLFAISGVSGGSAGAALFAHLADQRPRQEATTPCATRRVAQVEIRTEPPADACRVVANGATTGTYREAACRFLREDFLSPLAAMLIIPTLAQRALTWIWLPESWSGNAGVYDRARALEHGFEVAARKTNGRTVNGETLFDRPVSPLPAQRLAWDPQRSVPALLLNTTRVDTGERYVIAPFAIGSSEASGSRGNRVLGNEMLWGDLRVATAIGLSARFPFVTPPGTVEIGQPVFRSTAPERARIGFVDGGYADNSGLAAANQVAMLLKLAYDQVLQSGQPRALPAGMTGIDIHVLAIGDMSMLARSYLTEFRFKNQALTGVAPDLLPLDEQVQAVDELTAPLTAVLAGRAHGPVNELHHGINVMRALRAAGPQARVHVNLPMAFLALSPSRKPVALGWYLTDHARRRLDARLFGGEASRLDPIVALDAAAKPGEAAQKTFNPVVEAALRRLGEDLSLLPDVALVDAGIGGIRRTISPAAPASSAR